MLAPLKPGYIEKLVNYAFKARAEIKPDDDKFEKLELAAEFQEALCKTTFVNRKKNFGKLNFDCFYDRR